MADFLLHVRGMLRELQATSWRHSVANYGSTLLILQQKQKKYIETPKTQGLIFFNMLLALGQKTLAAILRGRNIAEKILLLSTTAQ